MKNKEMPAFFETKIWVYYSCISVGKKYYDF